MRSSNGIVPGFVLLCCGTVAFSGGGPSSDDQLAERIRIQEARVPQIEALAAQDREQVEQWYRRRRAEIVRVITRPEAARFSFAQRDLWVARAPAGID